MKCEIKMALQQRALKPSVFHFNLKAETSSPEEFSAIKAEIGNKMQNWLQNLILEKWVLLIPVHLIKSFKTLYER